MAALVLTRCAVDLDRGVVLPHDGGAPVRLTTKELGLVRHLASRAGPVARDELLTQVWGYSPLVASRVCDTTITRLRAKIEVDPSSPDHIRTVHGEGYQLVVPSRDDEPQRPAVDARPRLLELDGVQLDLEGLRVVAPHGESALTANEAAILRRLLRSEEVVDRSALARAVWGDSRGRDGRLHSAIHRLRAKLEADAGAPRVLRTEGDGYRLVRAGRGATRGLPVPSDRRFGPSAPVDEVLARLAQDRLVTLTGLGGIGKSRLALTAGLALEDAGRALAWVESADAWDLETFATLIARALGAVVPSGPDPMAAVARVVRARGPLVLVLDNLEQLRQAGDGVRVLLEQAPGLTVLATSRARLRIRGERIVRVAPLALADAVALFVDRAARPPDDLAEVEQLVRELDGLPLALELAAAATRVLPVAEIRHHHLVSAEGRPARQRSLGASLDLSWRLASPAAQAALAQLSVFRRWFTVERAEAVMELGPDAPPGIDVLEELVDASLAQVAPRGDRLMLPVVVAQYAADRLDEVARRGAERRHGLGMARLGSREALARLYGPRELEVRRELVEELENLVVAAERALAAADAPLASATACAAWRGFQVTGPARSAALLLERAAAVPGAEGRVATAAGEAWIVAGDNARAEAALASAEATDPWAVLQRLRVTRNRNPQIPGDADERVLEHAIAAGDRPLECAALRSIGIGQYCADRDWRPSMERALERAIALGGLRVRADTELCLAEMERSDGRFAEARRFAEAARAIGEAAGDLSMRSRALAELGRIEMLTGDLERARAVFVEVAATQRTLGDLRALCRTLTVLGEVLGMLLAYDDAEAALVEAIAVAGEAQAADTVRVALHLRAAVAIGQGRYDDADGLLVHLLDQARRGGSKRAEGAAWMGSAHLHAARGRVDEAYAAFEAASELLRPTDPVAAARVLADHGQVAVRAGEVERARRVTDEASALAAGVGPVAGRCRVTAGHLALGAGELESAGEHAAAAVGTFRATGERVQLARALMLRAEVELARGERGAAVLTLDEAAPWVERGAEAARWAAIRARAAEWPR